MKRQKKIAWSDNAWFKLICNHAPSHLGQTPTGDLQRFLSWRSISHTRARRKRQFPTFELQIDLMYVSWVHRFDPHKSKTRRFHNFYQRFLEFFERRIIDVIMKLNEQYI